MTTYLPQRRPVRSTRALFGAMAALLVAATLVVLPTPAGASAPPTLWVDAEELDFGPVIIGENSPAQTVRVTNAGPGTATGVTVGSPTSSQMARTATTCGATLAAGASCTASYRYQPTTKAEGFAKATITATGGTETSVFLRGSPDAFALALRVTPTGHDFGPVAVGATSSTRAVAITNQFPSAVQFTLAGQTPSGPFQLASNTCPVAPATLAAAATCNLSYTFKPTVAGPAAGAAPLAVTQVAVGTVPFPVTLRGHGGTAGAPVLTISPFSFDFGRVAVGTTAPSQAATVTNTSGTVQTITGRSGGGAGTFGGISTCTATLAPGASCTYAYAANPSTVGLIIDTTSGDLSITGHGDLRFDFAFTAYATGSAARPVLSPRRVNLGPAAIGTPTPSKVVTLHNTGTASLTGISIAQTGLVVPQMTTTETTCGPSLAAYASCTITFRYTPTTTNPTSAGFRVQASKPTQSIRLKGGPIQRVHENFVYLGYGNFLGRDPTTGEKSAAVSALDAGTTSRRAFVTDLANSDEWIQALVQDLYRNTLGRPGDSGGVTFWVGRIRSERNTVAQVAAEFYASNEYYNNIGGGTNSTWVTDLYTRLLNRTPDPGGLAYWVGQTSSKGRASVSGRMFQSAESRRARVTALYQQLLFRGPDPAGRNFWAGKIEDQGDIVLAIELASSTEFLRLSQSDGIG